MTPLLPRTSLKTTGFLVCLCLAALSFAASVALGQTPIPLGTVADALLNFDESSTEHIIVRSTRIPRAAIAAVVGASLAVSGALMQALTRNALASPGILGINAGAVFFIVLAATVFSVNSLAHYMWIGFLGAALAAVLVYFLGSLGGDGLSPLKIVLAGAAISALFLSFTQGMLVIDEQGLEGVLFWLAGSVAGRTMEMLLPVLPFMAGAGLLALFLGSHMNVLITGEQTAKGLGQRTVLIQILTGLVVVFLAGGSVAVAGSIGFVGLIVPHMVRAFVGIDYRWIIPYCALTGACLLLLADVAARFVIMPREVPIGVMTAFLGTPFFVYIARKGLARHE